MGCCGWRASDRDTVESAPTGPLDVIDRRRAEAESALVAATAGEPLCRITAGGDPTEPKFAEGALAAVIELQRQLRSTPDVGAAVVGRDLLARWEGEQAACAGRGVAWSAYRNGGVAELRRVVAELDADQSAAATSDSPL